MSDAPPPPDSGFPPGDAPSGPLTPAAIEAVLADFRTWLGELAAAPPEPPRPAVPAVDLHTLVAQFTALRHEVNMQTKAARAAVESNAETLKQLAARTEAGEPEDDGEEVRPLLKAVLDVADALAVSLDRMARLNDVAEPLLDELEGPADDEDDPPATSRPGFMARLFGGAKTDAEHDARRKRDGLRAVKASEAADTLRQLIAAAADGYAMSLRRVERALPAFGLDRIDCVGMLFDPDEMEVVDVAADAEGPPGTVVDEVRAGYRWRGRVFRFAQVRVAR